MLKKGLTAAAQPWMLVHHRLKTQQQKLRSSQWPTREIRLGLSLINSDNDILSLWTPTHLICCCEHKSVWSRSRWINLRLDLANFTYAWLLLLSHTCSWRSSDSWNFWGQKHKSCLLLMYYLCWIPPPLNMAQFGVGQLSLASVSVILGGSEVCFLCSS